MPKEQAIFVRTGSHPSILSNQLIGYNDLKDALNTGWIVKRVDPLSYNNDNMQTGLIYILQKVSKG